MKRGAPEHPKVYDLAERLGVRRPTAIGHLELLFHFAAQYAPEGDIGKYSDKRIAAALDWPGPTQRLIESLTTSGWVDYDNLRRLVVHDWSDHIDKVTRRRLDRLGKIPVKPDQQDTDKLTPKGEHRRAHEEPLRRRTTTTPTPTTTYDDDAQRLPSSPVICEWPETAAAIRGYFPPTDDALVTVVVHDSMRAYSESVNGYRAPPLTDPILAEAVHEAHFKSQTSAGPFRQRVPRCVRTWIEQEIKRGTLPSAEHPPETLSN